MRILRITSPEVQTSRFEASMPAPIICQPGTKMSLKSLSFQIAKSTSFNIPDNTYSFDFGVGDGNLYTVTLPAGNYNQVSLIQKLKYLMNSALSGNYNQRDTNHYGFEWTARVTSDDFFVLSFGRVATRNQTSDRLKLIKMNYDVGNNKFSRDATATSTRNDYTSYGQCKNITCRGGMSTAIKLTATDDATAQATNFFVALHEGITPDNRVAIADMKFAVFNGNEQSRNGYYAIKKLGGGYFQTDQQIKNNDIICIYKDYEPTSKVASINFGVIADGTTEMIPIYAQTLKPDAPLDERLIYDNLVNTSLHYTFAFSAKNDQPTGAQVQFEGCAITESPFQISTAQGEYSMVDELPDVFYSDLAGKDPSNVNLVFPYASLRNLLGFVASDYDKFAISGSFVAENIFAIGLNKIGDDLVVVINNDVELDGYDFLTGLKSNILAVIPMESLNVDKTGSGYSYVETNPVFIDIKNKYNINLNTLNVSIKAGNQYLNLEDKIYMQILLD